ncbi:MAG TPA: hypothetical protein VNX21_07425 [Candidatus Thermoplasmatota archaeon]|nr:hypothetical protein [Candidatus Thermoplasmatota archaeon]
MPASRAQALGAVAAATVAFGALLQSGHPLLARHAPEAFLRAGALLALAYPLAALVLAEPARAARDPGWWAVALLAGLAATPLLLGVLLDPLTAGLQPIFGLYALGPVAVVLAGWRLARTRGLRLGRGALALAVCYAAALLLQQVALRALPRGGMEGMLLLNVAAGLVPLLLVAYLLAAVPPPPTPLRAAGIVAAVVGSFVAVTSMQVLRGLDGARPVDGIDQAAFSAFSLGMGGLYLGIVLLATAAARADEAPPRADPAPADAPPA